ncbi:MAG: DUF4349 domain-containing protein [Dehalococcoidia bacterium]
MNRLAKYALLLALVAALVISVACAQSSVTKKDSTTWAGMAPAPAPASAPSGFAVGRSAETDYYAADGAGADESAIDRKIVRTGSMSMEVEDISKAQAEIAEIAVQYDGYVVTSNLNADKEHPNGFISFRVPAGKFDDALVRLRQLAVKVTHENSSSQDVTEQYTDLKAQLSNYEATEAQYLELLKKADNVKDMLEVQRELSSVRGNIERIKGRMQYLEKTSDTSLIEVSLSKSMPIGESTWDISGVFKGAVDGLIAFGKVLLSVLIWLLVFSPVWIIALVIIFIVRRRKKAKSGASTTK